MMGCSPPRGDQFISDPTREWKVRDPVTMQVPELTPAEAKLDAAEAVRRNLYIRPPSNRRRDPPAGADQFSHRFPPQSPSPQA